MLKNFFKTTFRNLLKNKSYTFINLAGLSLGVECALTIFLIIKFEFSFDTHQSRFERIYRVVTESNEFGEVSHGPGVPYPLPEAMRTDFPEIEYLTIVDCNFGDPVISVEQAGNISRYRENDNEVAFVHADYLNIFDHDWLMGNRQEALKNPNSAVISKEFAQKYFGDGEVLGRRLTFNNRLKLSVTGVFGEVPKNTDMPFHLLITYDHAGSGNDNWGGTSTSVQCYITLPDDLNPEQLESRFDSFIAKHRNQDAADKLELSLQPFSEIHFDERFGNFGHRTVEKRTLLTLGLIGMVMLATACINFINLNTALAVKRSKEVGVRKVMGSSRRQLVFHFLGETGIISLIAVLVSLPLTELIVVNLQALFGYSLDAKVVSHPEILWFLGLLFVAVTLVAGFYPAIHLSGFSPIEAIRNKINVSYGEGISLRRGLVALQFAISQVLIISTIVISGQLNYFRSVDLGFNKEAVVEVSLPTNEQAKLVRLKNDLLAHAGIKQVAFSNTGTASGNTWGGNYSFKRGEETREGHAQLKFVDGDFIETYQLQLLAGGGLAGTDTLQSFVVNKAFVEEVGYGANYHEVIGKYVKIWGREAPVGGVVQNFNTISLHYEVQPVIMLMQNRFWQAGIKIDMRDLDGAIAAVESAWTSVYPEFVFEYSFLDDTIESFYEEERKTGKLINVFTTVAILIGCMGLLGLVSYMANQRTKEIGIRKVLGANFSNILSLFSREFAVLILVAFAAAAPVGYFFMHSWLADFAYRIDLDVTSFLLALTVSCLIALLTVGYKSAQAAATSPVDSLRSE